MSEKDSTRVTGQPAPPTPRPELVQAICRGYLATQHLSNPLQVAERIAVEVEAAAQPFTPPQPPPPYEFIARELRVLDHWFKWYEDRWREGGEVIWTLHAQIAELKAQAAPPSLTAPLEKFGNEVSAGGESAGGNTETLTSVSAPEQRNPSGKPQPSARPSDAHSQFTSLTAEELAPLLKAGNVNGAIGGVSHEELAKRLCSLPGIKVVRG